MGIDRKSQKVSAFNFDSKGVKMGAPCDPGPEDPPPDPDRVKGSTYFDSLLITRLQISFAMQNT